MKTRNTLSPRGYLFYSLIWGAASCTFCAALFRPQLQTVFSGWLLSAPRYALFFAALAYLILLLLFAAPTVKRERNFRRVLENSLLAGGPLCVPVALRFRLPVAAVLLSLWLLLLLRHIIVLCTGQKPAGISRPDFVGKKARYVILRARSALSAVVCGCFLLGLSVLRFGTGEIVKPRVIPDQLVEFTDIFLLRSSEDMMAKLAEPVWYELSPEEKVDLLQKAVNIEASYLGLPEAPALVADALPGHVNGRYSHQARLIMISTHRLNDSSRECLLTVLHESYHAYQSFLCDSFELLDGQYQDLLYYTRIREYLENFQNYESGGEDYAGQIIEQTARAYAREHVDDYFGRIERFLRQEAMP